MLECGRLAIVVHETCVVKFNRLGEARQRFRALHVEFFFGQIEKPEYLRRRSQRLHEKLIDVADSFDGFVGFKQRESKRAKRTDRHAAGFNFTAGEEENNSDAHSAQKIHNRPATSPCATLTAVL